ncbi:MAG: capsular polysaccharide biosynthesis protein [Neisseriaceae bacterium]|nr:capsular polysaccharide biosynthesis protein [Neisseriaceae bacterium]
MKSAYIHWHSYGIRRIPHIAAFLSPDFVPCFFQRHADVVIGWGNRPTTKKARQIAAKKGVPFVALEDGFLRSLGLGDTPPLSICVDNLGIYYDIHKPSSLEQYILDNENISLDKHRQARQAIDLIIENKLSKYNLAPIFRLSESNQPKVLVIDQTYGDVSIQGAKSDENTFKQMFQAALQENPNAQIIVKTHPDVFSGKRQGYLTEVAKKQGVTLLYDNANPIDLLQQVDKVYCVCSHMGFEALMCGKSVTVFGAAWYAGWGLTDDRHPEIAQLQSTKRRKERTLLQLFAAAYFDYCRYVNTNGVRCSLFDIINYLIQIKHLHTLLRGEVYCVGFSLWKKAAAVPYFRLPECRVHFVSSIHKIKDLSKKTKIVVWGIKNKAAEQFAADNHLPLLRMEDGFLRSVGLGSNLVAPLSLAFDDAGIYFDPNRPSRLENILQNHKFNNKNQQGTQVLIELLQKNKISKYNIQGAEIAPNAAGKRVLLVPGQVEDDMSVQLGSPKIRTNLDLLKTVRETNPNAYIIYKPHPDVLSGNRIGHIPPDECQKYADEIATNADIFSCIEAADEVHTMTSLTGFEALIRHKTVHCYGMPFYAGWGLTIDEVACERRNRRLELWQLVWATLIAYPAYIHPHTHRFITAETAAFCMLAQKQNTGGGKIHRNFFSRNFGKIKQLIKVLLMK